MSEITGKIVSASLEEEVTFNDGKRMNKYVIDLAVGDERKNDLVMWLPINHKKPPAEGEEGAFEVNGSKVKRVKQGGGGYGGGGGGGYRPTAPEDAQRMSRASALSAVCSMQEQVKMTSDQVVATAAKFADFIYNGPKEQG